jgi:ribosome biogenesis GTPase
MTLEALGWNARRQDEFAAYAADGLLPGRVVGEHRTHFQVGIGAIELTAEMTGRLRTAATRLAVPTIRRLLKAQRLG